jgi:hypothetical protein
MLSLGSNDSYVVKPYNYPMYFAEKSDILIRCDSVTANNTKMA